MKLASWLRERSRPNPLLDEKTRAFLDAVRDGELAKVTAMLDAEPSLAFTSDRGMSAFLLAVRYRRRLVRDLLLARGVEPDLWESLEEALLDGNLKRVKALVEKDPMLSSGLRFICSSDGRGHAIQRKSLRLGYWN